MGFETQKLKLDSCAGHLCYATGHVFVCLNPVLSTMMVRNFVLSFEDLISNTT